MLLVGIQDIDNQHKELFKIGREIENMLIKNCIGVDNDELLHVLYQLRDYATYHFIEENRFMHKINYPEYEVHKLEHDKFINYINKIDYVSLCKNPEKDLKMIQERMMDQVAQHIVLEDAKFKTFIKDNNIDVSKIN